VREEFSGDDPGQVWLGQRPKPEVRPARAERAEIAPARGRHMALPLHRRWMGDLVAASMSVPVMAAERTLRVGDAAAMRRRIAGPPGWSAIIVKACALASARRPELRRVYLTFPWPHLYEHPISVATVVMERVWRGETCLFFDQIIAPESKPIMAIDAAIAGLRRNPIESIGGYRRLIRISRLPIFVRRPLWWAGLRGSGYLHARYFGTFSINTIGLPRTRVGQTTTPITLSLTHMPLEPPGLINISAAFDHRVVDGMAIGRALGEMEAIINDELVAELRELAEAGGGPRPRD
jgi:hypothetical protein